METAKKPKVALVGARHGSVGLINSIKNIDLPIKTVFIDNDPYTHNLCRADVKLDYRLS